MLLLSKGTYDGDSETALERVCNSWSGANVGYCDGPAAGVWALAVQLDRRKLGATAREAWLQ